MPHLVLADLVGMHAAQSPPLMVLAIAISLALLARFGGLFTDAATALAEQLRIPPLIVGATIVSLATTAPELVVSWTAAAAGEPDVALGNALGSCACNLGLVVGASAVLFAFIGRGRSLSHTVIHFSSVRGPWLLILGGTGLLWVAGALNEPRAIAPWEAAILIGLAPLYLAICIWTRTTVPVESAGTASTGGWGLRRTAVIFLFSTGIILLSARVLTANCAQLARELGVDDIVIGLTILAIGTSLPELVCSLSAVVKGRNALAMGNILGANILNLSGGIGVTAVITPVTIDQRSTLLYLPGALVLTALVGIMLFRQQRVSGRSGLVLLGTYSAYLLLASFSHKA